MVRLDEMTARLLPQLLISVPYFQYVDTNELVPVFINFFTKVKELHFNS